MTPEHACVFDCERDELIGIISPACGQPAAGVLIIVGGPQYRIGSHRQFRLLASRLSTAGIPVMRFDQRGTGDSSGNTQGFEGIGPDVGAAIDSFAKDCPSVREVVLLGLCDGASAALLYWHATRDTRVAGLILLNPWVRSDESLARTHVRHYYGQRLLQREFWAKVLRGRFGIGESIRDFAGALARMRKHSRGPEVGGRFQDRMAAGLAAFPGRVLLILSGHDFTAKEFVDYCGTVQPWIELIKQGKIERFDVPEADHTFSSAAWRKNVEEMSLTWLKRWFTRNHVHRQD